MPIILLGYEDLNLGPCTYIQLVFYLFSHLFSPLFYSNFHEYWDWTWEPALNMLGKQFSTKAILQPFFSIYWFIWKDFPNSVSTASHSISFLALQQSLPQLSRKITFNFPNGFLTFCHSVWISLRYWIRVFNLDKPPITDERNGFTQVSRSETISWMITTYKNMYNLLVTIVLIEKNVSKKLSSDCMSWGRSCELLPLTTV